jgi:hypothetical protein
VTCYKPPSNIIDNIKSQYYGKKKGESDKLTYNNNDKIQEIQNKMFWTGVRVKKK